MVHRMKAVAAGCAATAILAGCAVNYPQNAQEFREQMPGAMFGQKKTLEANRPFRDVVKTLQAKAPECLNVSVRTISQSATSYQNVLETYKPTVIVGAQKAELHVQKNYKGGGIIIPGKVPEGGMYFLVADATPIDRTRTRIDIYGPTRGANSMIRAVTGWATGENIGCPDLTKD